MYLLYWGSAWEGTLAFLELQIFFKNLASEPFEGPAPSENSWEGILNQYTQVLGEYHDAKIAGEARLNATKHPTELTREKIVEEINLYIANGAKPGPNTQFIVMPAPGTTYAETLECGYHTVASAGKTEYAFSLVPYAGDRPKCNYAEYKEESKENELAKSTTAVASHEFAETATDPQLIRTFTNSRGKEEKVRIAFKDLHATLTEGEIADLCDEREMEEPGSFHAAQELPAREGLEGFSFVTTLWDNRDGDNCQDQDPPAPTPSAPTATTGAVGEIEENTVKLEGSINPNVPATHYYFQYGTTTAYGSYAPAPPPGYEAGAGTSTIPVSASLSGLTPNTEYHYRVVAENWVGKATGEDKTFRTRAWKIQTTQNPHGSSETDEFRGVSCWSATGCDAVGVNTNAEDEIVGLVERWNGSAWAVQSTPKSTGAKEDNLESVACRSASECEATGYAEVAEGKHVTLAERWNGTAWAVQTTPTKGNDSNLVSVSCASASECVASGFYLSSAGKKAALVELWNGKEWKILTTATLPKEDEQSWLESISCPSTKHCTAVGAVVTTLNGIVPLAESYNGTTWTVQTTPTPEHSIEAQLSGVSCSATNACTAVGGYDNSAEKGERALIERYNGTSWQLQEAASPVGKPAPEGSHWALSAVSCPTSSSCVTVGSYAESATARKLLLGEQWNGTSWELALPANRTAALYDEARSVSCSAALTCTLAGLSWKENNHNLTETLAERMEG